MDFTDHLARSSVCPQESIYLGDLCRMWNVCWLRRGGSARKPPNDSLLRVPPDVVPETHWMGDCPRVFEPQHHRFAQTHHP